VVNACRCVEESRVAHQHLPGAAADIEHARTGDDQWVQCAEQQMVGKRPRLSNDRVVFVRDSGVVADILGEVLVHADVAPIQENLNCGAQLLLGA